MQKKLTISIDEKIYYALCEMIGRGKISRFIEELVKSKIGTNELESGYKQMAADKTREAEALEWTEATFGDIVNEAW